MFERQNCHVLLIIFVLVQVTISNFEIKLLLNKCVDMVVRQMCQKNKKNVI